MANVFLYQTVPYNPPSTHPFHTLDLWYPHPTDQAFWVIFIHGGAWRDPTDTKPSGRPLLTHLLNHFSSTTPTIPLNAASIDYRLSPHPVHAPVGETVMHPAHLEDVQAALGFLSERYQMRKYILVGHSAGATLAFQVLGTEVTPGGEKIPIPRGIVGLAGIYDLVSLVEEYPDYLDFVEGAFGSAPVPGRNIRAHPWDLASPAKDTLCQGYAKFFDGVKGWIVLVQSSMDGLLSTRQMDEMRRVLGERYNADEVVYVAVGDFGGHNEMLRERQVWEMVERVVENVAVGAGLV